MRVRTIRSQILWIGDPPNAAIAKEFEVRRLKINATTAPQPDDFSSAQCAIFDFDPSNEKRSVGLVRTILADTLMHGLNPIILIDNDHVPKIQTEIASFPSRIRFPDRSSHLAADLAEDARSFDPGFAAKNDLLILGESLEKESAILLQRAFSDFVNVQLIRLSAGKSGADVFQANANREPGIAGERPLPYLVKIEELRWSEKERKAYREYVEGHVPFNQRPNLDPSRCMSGATKGILVGDFVLGAAPLNEIAHRPEGRNALYSLFDDALLSWRRDAFATNPTSNSLLAHLPVQVRPEAISAMIISQANAYGLKATPQNLYATLEGMCQGNFRLGMVHGDLHPGNVMVRLGEAILIDFGFCDQPKAIVADLASLDVGLAFSAAAKSVEEGENDVVANKFSAWRQEVAELFSLRNVMQTPYHEDILSPFAWLWGTSRQLRGMGRLIGVDGRQYACALAAYLLRRARLGSLKGENIHTSAMALLVAERLINEIKGEQPHE